MINDNEILKFYNVQWTTSIELNEFWILKSSRSMKVKQISFVWFRVRDDVAKLSTDRNYPFELFLCIPMKDNSFFMSRHSQRVKSLNNFNLIKIGDKEKIFFFCPANTRITHIEYNY